VAAPGRDGPLEVGPAEVGIEDTSEFMPRFDESGLIPCVTVDAANGDVLMMAWMNEDALSRTLQTGLVHYWSRSRQALWKKGETSGALQHVLEISTDCDQDVLLVRASIADRSGTCHTGRDSCFYRRVPLGAGPIRRRLEAIDPAAD
jgi:phosphoribosyl-AMP cyclohydrolase